VRSKNRVKLRATLIAALCLLLAAALTLGSGPLTASPSGASTSSAPALNLSSASVPAKNNYRIYTFAEVSEQALIHSVDILKQKQSIAQAEFNVDYQRTTFQDQAFNYYADPESNINESTLYNLQDNYESAITAFEDAEEALKKLKPKVEYQAQKLYLDILQGEVQIQIQEMEVKRLDDEYELAKVKAIFGVLTQTQLKNAKTQVDNARDNLDNLVKSLNANKKTMREYLGLKEDADFGLKTPPYFGEYTEKFEADATLSDALKNSVSLKQAQKELDDLDTQKRKYEDRGEYNQARRVTVSVPAKEQSLKDAKNSLIKTVENALEDYDGYATALKKAEESLEAARAALVLTKTKLSVGLAKVNDARLAEKAVAQAEKEHLQARYNRYLGARKVSLMREGILVN